MNTSEKKIISSDTIEDVVENVFHERGTIKCYIDRCGLELLKKDYDDKEIGLSLIADGTLEFRSFINISDFYDPNDFYGIIVGETSTNIYVFPLCKIVADDNIAGLVVSINKCINKTPTIESSSALNSFAKFSPL